MKSSDSLRLRTDRLELIAATHELVYAERFAREQLPKLLGAVLPPAWPPPLNDESSLNWALEFIAVHPEAIGWSMWYFVLIRPDAQRVAVGNGGFKGLPANGGTVEMGYSLLEEYQGRGIATEAIRTLTRWAFDHAEVLRVTAETYPHLRRSLRVLEKCGFSYIGQGSELLTIRFELTREEYDRLNSTGLFNMIG